MNRTFSALALIAILFLQCSDKSHSSEYPIVHFDIQGLMKEQINALEKNQAGLQKALKFNSRESIINLDSIEWEKEFRMLRALDINKPALVPLYDSIIEGNYVRYYPIKESNKASVKNIVIEKFPGGNIKSLKGIIEEDNYLYSSASELKLNFSETPNLIESYSINVTTKVIFRDQEVSLINGKIIN